MNARLRWLFGGRSSPLRHVPWLQRHLRRRFLRANAIAVRVADDAILCRILGHLKLYAPAHDSDITPHLALDGYWEPWVTEVIVDRLAPGDVAIDVGANVGYFTLLMARLVGRGGRVLSFEPHPGTVAFLRRSLRANGFAGRVDCHALPLADADGHEVLLVTPQDQPGSAHIVPAAGSHGLPVAPTRRLDGIAGAHEAVLVKLDAEGAEERIWHGMRALLKGSRLRHVVIEFSRDAYEDPRGLLEDAAAHGFALFLIHRSGRLSRRTVGEVLAGSTQQMLLFER